MLYYSCVRNGLCFFAGEKMDTEQNTQRKIRHGDIVTVTVDRPLGSYHPEHKDMYYPINYGYIEGVIAADGEEQDAYILGVTTMLRQSSSWLHRAAPIPQSRSWSRSTLPRSSTNLMSS